MTSTFLIICVVCFLSYKLLEVLFESIEYENNKKELYSKYKQYHQLQIEREVEDIFRRMVSDFNSNSYNDKYTFTKINGGLSFQYRFESGETISINNNGELRANNAIYKLNPNFRSRFIDLANGISSKGYNRSSYKKSTSQESAKKAETSQKVTPQRYRFNLLNEKIKMREDQLRVMSKFDSNRISLENELRGYKKIRDKIKSENNF